MNKSERTSNLVTFQTVVIFGEPVIKGEIMIKKEDVVIVSPEEFEKVLYWEIECPYCGENIATWDNPYNSRSEFCPNCKESFKIRRSESR